MIWSIIVKWIFIVGTSVSAINGLYICMTSSNEYGICLSLYSLSLCSKHQIFNNRMPCSSGFFCCTGLLRDQRNLHSLSPYTSYPPASDFSSRPYSNQLPPITASGFIQYPNPNPYIPDSCNGGSSGYSRFIKGRLSPRILGGQQAEENEFCWMASIFDRESEDYIGGGALIKGQWIVTTAYVIRSHVSPYQLKVLIGNTFLDHSIWVGTPCLQYLDVIQVVIHPQYNAGNAFQNNIALLKLSTPADFRRPDCICTVCLPSQIMDYSGETCVVSGYGALSENGEFPQLLHKITVPILDDAFCQRALSSTSVTPGQFCAGGQGGRDACQGDGGSPLVCSDDFGSKYLAGLVSAGFGCGHPGIPALYTKISYYVNFIESVTQV